MPDSRLDDICINALRFLSIDAVESARSGHPGAPMGAAPLVYTLWDRFLKHNPMDPHWPDRDRFILSAGHASALLYALLHLTGYALSLEDIRQFRRWGSLTPGHPEYGRTPGVEATTGPLGQGFANGIGLAIAERRLAQRYNRPDYPLFDHFTYALVSDGDLQEGIASEAASLAGTLKLHKLIYLYDSNGIQLDGPTVSFREDVALRFQAYGWNVIGPVEGLDTGAIEQAIRSARSETGRPSLIICRTVIGYGSPHKAGTSQAHGEPLGGEETALTRANLNWPYPPFTIPPEVNDHMRQTLERGRQQQAQWQAMLEAYRKEFPQLAEELDSALKGDLPPGWDKGMAALAEGGNKPQSTRDVSGKALNLLAANVPSLMGGSADLAGSTRTYLKDGGEVEAGDYRGRNLRYGVREHAMGAISNGLALHGGFIPFASTFLVFADYLRPAVRLAALMKIHVIFVFTHDSIGVGEDGPTHQPVEQLMSLRLIPDLVTLRPADAAETVEALKIAIQRKDGPTALVLTRQDTALMDRSLLAPASGLRQGGYVLRDSEGAPRVVLIGTGSEVGIALESADILQKRGIASRVVSMPSWELFEAQPAAYRQNVLPPDLPLRVSIEAGTTLGWERYTGGQGLALGITHFGASAPGGELYRRFGLTAQDMADAAMNLLRYR